ncbi:hypothetical protein GCM10022245_04400 [Streptomyces mayteni]
MASQPEGHRRDQQNRWYNRARWVGPLYAVYRFIRDLSGL